MDTLHGGNGGDRKLSAAAAERNCGHILDKLLPLVEQRIRSNTRAGSMPTRVLEVASGTGQHAAALCDRLEALNLADGRSVVVHPSDLRSEDGFGSIRAYAHEHRGVSVCMNDPIHLDCAAGSFVDDFRKEAGVDQVDIVLCINMTHISPVEATEGLIRGAGALLAEGGVLAIYGPFKDKDGKFTSDSNAAFDASLRSRDPSWGYRSVRFLDERCVAFGLTLEARTDMPANNCWNAYRKA